jgi:hypothetical protein
VVSLNDLMKKQDSQCTYNVTLRRFRATTVAVEKLKLLHILNVFVALGIQHAMRKSRTVICGLPGSTRVFHINS